MMSTQNAEVCFRLNGTVVVLCLHLCDCDESCFGFSNFNSLYREGICHLLALWD